MYIIANSVTPLSSQDVLEHVASMASFAFVLEAMAEFWPVLFLSIAVLVAGRLARWPIAHLSVPFLAWAWHASVMQIAWFNNPVHVVVLVSQFLRAMVALALTIGMVALVVLFQSRSEVRCADLLSLLVSLLAVATVSVDWMFMVLVIMPWLN